MVSRRSLVIIFGRYNLIIKFIGTEAFKCTQLVKKN